MNCGFPAAQNQMQEYKTEHSPRQHTFTLDARNAKAAEEKRINAISGSWCTCHSVKVSWRSVYVRNRESALKSKVEGGKMEEGNLLPGIISNEKTTSSTKSHIALI